MHAVLNESRRLDLPAALDGDVRALLVSCWRTDPAARPSFGEIAEALDVLPGLPCLEGEVPLAEHDY